MNSSAPRTLARVLLIALFAAATIRTVGVLATRPQQEWDMLAYMGLALAWEDDDPQSIHRRTYEAAERELDPRQFRRLTRAGVRQARYRDAGAFHEHLAFYRSRVLYTLPVYLLYRAGAPLSAATWWMSLACFAATAALILAWCARHLPLWLAVPVALGLAHAPPLVAIARQSTPDALYVLVTAGAVYALVEYRSLRAAAGLLVASLLVRADAILFQLFLVPALLAFGPRAGRPRAGFAAAWLALAVGVYATATLASGYYGWWPLFSIGFLGKEVHPSGLPTTPDLAVYWRVLNEQMAATTDSVVFAYGAFALLGLAYWRQRRADSVDAARCAAVLAAFLPTYALRYLLFPELWERFFVPFTVLVPLLLLSIAARPRPQASAAAG